MKVFLDITPVLMDNYNTPLRLGTVRYLVNTEDLQWLNTDVFPFRTGLMSRTIEHSIYRATDQLGVWFEIMLTDAETPQPETLAPQPIPPQYYKLS